MSDTVFHQLLLYTQRVLQTDVIKEAYKYINVYYISEMFSQSMMTFKMLHIIRKWSARHSILWTGEYFKRNLIVWLFSIMVDSKSSEEVDTNSKNGERKDVLSIRWLDGSVYLSIFVAKEASSREAHKHIFRESERLEGIINNFIWRP